MNITNLMVAALIATTFLTACNQQAIKQTAETNMSKTVAVTKPTITEDEVNAAQQAWCDALVKIGKIHEDGGDG